ncbi:2-dehydro-3-deoxygalactonokinase [Sphingomonas quercus]|uniref:2-dehydro-3-deoxygalactonokinase n=1 Tax=Sphingomonas quercus TaxID=2842451 RepID=A0ABS6BL84_9SPHN|nr:2-dehydro-3-deoxygalactonokinase [Sphingomonas quercus]MBU3079053.1 2-dehydro-3-deoxygalactonokinase [Sphingomonas quercus]
MASPFLVLDWGTTNLRAWVVGEDGRVGGREEFPMGIGRLAAGEAARLFEEKVRPRMGAEALPALACGMIGSNLGWGTPVPYLDCPAGMTQLHDSLCTVSDGGAPVRIVPGLHCERPDGGPDVMRGEETHIFGWAAGDPARLQGEHLICLPGTHAKWVRLVDGRVEQFVTYMTGELFDVLRRHSVLRGTDTPDNDDAFDEGCEAAGDGGALASRLFTARSRVAAGQMPADRASSYLSGLLIGAEIASAPTLLGVAPETPVAIVGDPRLGQRYVRSMTRRGWTATAHDGDEAVLAGLVALANGGLA